MWRQVWELIGWEGLSPAEQAIAATGALVALGCYLLLQLGLRVLFGWLLRRLPSRRSARRRGKARR